MTPLPLHSDLDLAVHHEKKKIREKMVRQTV